MKHMLFPIMFPVNPVGPLKLIINKLFWGGKYYYSYLIIELVQVLSKFLITLETLVVIYAGSMLYLEW